MASNVLQAPFDLVHRDYAYANGFDATSPPSSPCSFVDSSPPSSPIDETFEFDVPEEGSDANSIQNGFHDTVSPNTSPSSSQRVDSKEKGKLLEDLETSPAHPFAASTRAIKRPPNYSKDTMRPKLKRSRNGTEDWDVYTVPRHVRIHERDEYIQSAIPSLTVSSDSNDERDDALAVSSLLSQDPEYALWEETLAQAVDSVECRIDLSGHDLTYIPPQIADLSKLVVIRDRNGPPRDLAPRRTCSKSTSSLVFGTAKLGHREDEIHLFLSRNSISSLPNELFNLDALVVLSLRANNLTEIPPLIGQLRNLRELNVANNKLRHLPSEIMSLNLISLAIDPNPFEENPFAKSEPFRDRWFGPIQRKHTVVPLVEIVLRFLLAPSSELYGSPKSTSVVSGTRRHETVLEHSFDIPIQSDYMKSPSLRNILSSCVPGSIASTQSPHMEPHTSPEAARRNAYPRPCISVCQSFRHLGIGRGKYRRPIFVMHAEERLSWEKHIAGLKVGGETGIPVRWRGCSAGCLEYLEQADEVEADIETQPEEDWSVGIDVDVKQQNEGHQGVVSDDLASVSLVRPPSKIDFKMYDSADIDLGV